MVTPIETVGRPFTSSIQHKLLLAYIAAVILPVSVVFALLYSTFNQYILSYGVDGAASTVTQQLLVWVSLAFITVWIPLIIAITVKCIYRLQLSKLPTMQVLGILFLSSGVVAVAVWCALEAISDPNGWGLIKSIFVIPLAALLGLSLLIATLGIGKELQNRYKSSVFLAMPLISLVLVLAVVFIQQDLYAKVQSIYEHNTRVEYEKDTLR